MNEVMIREATAADATVIADLSHRTFYDTFAAVNTAANMDKFFAEQFKYEDLVREVGLPGNIFLLVLRNNTPVGYTLLREGADAALGNADAIEIVRIYLAKTEQGKGTGTMLMQRCIDLAVQLKKNTIWLGVWEHNATAIAFYHKWGFEQFGSHIFMLGDDEQTDWLMKKAL